ncbi:MAG: oligoendopeptidase F [Anaerolineae bacterium]|nr:oligoendopeptidase F [Anaerolineae bacterium]
MSEQVPMRSEIPDQFKWNAPSVFESVEAWQAEFEAVAAQLPTVAQFKGRLGEGAATLAEAMEAIDDLLIRAGKLFVYASMSQSVDMTDQTAIRRAGQAQGLFGRVQAAVSFVDPELLVIGQDVLKKWIAEEPRLAHLGHYVDDLFRQQAHVRSAEVEEVLGMLSDPFRGAGSTAGMLANADFKFKPALGSDDKEYPLTQGTLGKLLSSPDREVRRTAWEHYADEYLAHRNALAACLATSLKQNVFKMRVRGHSSTLAATLFEHNVPVQVFHNLIDTFRKNLPTWHRYWAIRRRALGVDQLHPYDIWAPLSDAQPLVPYEQAVEWICAGLAPLGADYVERVRRGCLHDRWVDVYPNQGKRNGAFSSGSYGTHPFIMMSYNDNLFSLSTLAHELGHSMHSYLTRQHQPFRYSRYALFVAEVASNFHQAMVRAHLLKTNPDPAFQVALIEEAMSNFHRYFFIMPTLARFELETHERIERGEGLTADDMINLMADLFDEGYGGEVRADREREGITWATFNHLYVDYYVYQYATGISGANALAKGILSGQEGAADHSAMDRYLSFLKAGGSLYPLDALKLAGVDLTTPAAVEVAFGVLAGLVDRLEKLVG